MFFIVDFSAHARSFGEIFINIGICILALIIFLVYHGYRDAKKRKRDKQIETFAKRKKLRYLPFFGEPLKFKDSFNCFNGMSDLSFINVIEKIDKDKVRIYIGELQWVKPMGPVQLSKGNFDFSPSMGMDSSYDKFKNYQNMCVCFDDRFDLPDFDLMRETIGKKAAEVLRLNNTEDIDFDEDKEFSDAWWLSSNMNMVVTELFTREVRKKFMQYVNKNYRIVGRKNMLFIIADKLYEPEDYIKIESDMRSIVKFLSSNKKFYNSEYVEKDYL